MDEQLIIGQSDPDKEWREALPIELQPIAKEIGRELFAFVMNVNGLNFQISALSRQGAGNQRISQSIRSIAMHLDQLVGALMLAKGWTKAQVQTVTSDINRAAALAGPAAGGLIVPEGTRVN